MGWNKYFILVDNQKDVEIKEVLNKLGLGSYQPREEVSLLHTNKSNELYIGQFNDCLVFYSPKLTIKFFESIQSTEEQLFIQCFPKANILVLIENLTSDMFGFCWIHDGEKIRMRDGVDDEIGLDFGEPFPEELENYQDFVTIIDEEEKKEIIEYSGKEGFQNYCEFQGAWGVPNILSKKFLGKYIHNCGAIIQLTKYEN